MRLLSHRLFAPPMLAALLLAGLPAAQADSGTPEHAVRVSQAWIRWLPANLPAGGYLTLVNDGDHPASLVSVESPAYARVQLHRTLTDAGTSRMVPVSAVTIPPHGTLDFAKLGFHLMLEQARTSVAPGQTLDLTLHFADGGILRTLAQVRAPDGAPATGSAAPMPGMPGMPDMPGMSK